MDTVDFHKGFTTEEIDALKRYNIPTLSKLYKKIKKDPGYFKNIQATAGEMNQRLGGKKSQSPKISSPSGFNRREQIDNDIKTIRKFKRRSELLYKGLGEEILLGEGVKGKKPLAYKIVPNGRYGDLLIDLPRMMSTLILDAKDGAGNSVYRDMVDFDTLDLLTKRYNAKKKILRQSYEDVSWLKRFG